LRQPMQFKLNPLLKEKMIGELPCHNFWNYLLQIGAMIAQWVQWLGTSWMIMVQFQAGEGHISCMLLSYRRLSSFKVMLLCIKTPSLFNDTLSTG
jgi:hypothetical protein